MARVTRKVPSRVPRMPGLLKRLTKVPDCTGEDRRRASNGQRAGSRQEGSHGATRSWQAAGSGAYSANGHEADAAADGPAVSPARPGRGAPGVSGAAGADARLAGAGAGGG